MAWALCLVRGAVSVTLAASQFTLSWTHSIEKTRWEEQWRVGPAGLQVVRARVLGSGAGMEPPEGAVWEDGGWTYTPRLPPQPSVVLAASEFSADHELCIGGHCQALQRWIGGRGPVRLQACALPEPVSARRP